MLPWQWSRSKCNLPLVPFLVLVLANSVLHLLAHVYFYRELLTSYDIPPQDLSLPKFMHRYTGLFFNPEANIAVACTAQHSFSTSCWSS